MSWNYLKKSDIVDVIAPGYPCTPQEIEGARQFLLKWGLQPRIPRDIVRPHFLHSNEDEVRFTQLRQAIESKDSGVIWCLRGGYGSNRLLPYLAKVKKPKSPKLVIGISDITSLHTFFIQEWGWSVLHAPLLDRLGKNLVSAKHEKELYRVLFGDETRVTFNKLKPMNDKAKAVKGLRSRIVGGNMIVLQSTLGTPWQIDPSGCLLFLEDLGERGYRIDRVLEQFRQSGVLKKCRGLILGDFIGGAEPSTGKDNFKKVFKRWADDLNIPVFQGLEAGHGQVQRPVPFNTPCKLTVQNGRGILDIQVGGKKA